MRKLNNYLNELGLGWLWKTSVCFSIALLIAGFILPPMGVIDNSVLIGVGLLLFFVNLPVFLAFAHSHHVEAGFDIDDKEIKLTSKPTK